MPAVIGVMRRAKYLGIAGYPRIKSHGSQ